jgi:hypothetical protein
MWPSTELRRQFVAVGTGLYVVWLFATVLLVGSRVGLLPRLDAVEETVVAGAVVLTALGTLQLAKRGVERIRRLVE